MSELSVTAKELSHRCGVGAAAGKDAYSVDSNKTGQPKPPRYRVRAKPCLVLTMGQPYSAGHQVVNCGLWPSAIRFPSGSPL